MQNTSKKQTDLFRTTVSSAVLVMGATIALVSAIWFLKPASPTKDSGGHDDPAKPRKPRPALATGSLESTFAPSGAQWAKPKAGEVPEELQLDGIDAAHFAELQRQALESPADTLPKLLEEYNKATEGKAFWAEAIAFMYQDQLDKPMEAISWMETALLMHSRDKELPQALIELYAKTDEIGRAGDLVQRMEDGPVKSLIRAKIMLMVQNHAESRALLETIPENELDESSKKQLERNVEGGAS